MLTMDEICLLMVRKNASDIYVSVGMPVQIRLQGRVESVNDDALSSEEVRELIKQTLTEKQLAEYHAKGDLNTASSRTNIGRFRISCFTQRGECAMCIRYIMANIPSLNALGLPAVLGDMILEKRGLILIVGSTGAGKSTSLASAINHRNKLQTGHILTIEDPIEYIIHHGKSLVNQREVGLDTPHWHDALYNALRQAPDCVMIGEIRDQITMQAALGFSLTGHLVLATLHANNAHHAVSRIINMFPLENRDLLYLDLSVALRAIFSQRLVRDVNEKRIPAVELLINSRHISELIAEGNLGGLREAISQSLSVGSQTFEQDLLRLYQEGRISRQEALINADSATNLQWMMMNKSSGSAMPPEQVLDQEQQKNGLPAVSFSQFTISTKDE